MIVCAARSWSACFSPLSMMSSVFANARPTDFCTSTSAELNILSICWR